MESRRCHKNNTNTHLVFCFSPDETAKRKEVERRLSRQEYWQEKGVDVNKLMKDFEEKQKTN